MPANVLRAAILGVLGAALMTGIAAVAQDKPDPGEKAIKARRGFMQVVVWEAGPLFGMAKKQLAYDAAAATEHAANLKAISDYGIERLFVEGTSNADYKGKTRALPKIWEDRAAFEQGFKKWRAAVAKVAEEAGKGEEAFTAAAIELGKACGGCHKPYRAEEF